MLFLAASFRWTKLDFDCILARKSCYLWQQTIQTANNFIRRPLRTQEMAEMAEVAKVLVPEQHGHLFTIQPVSLRNKRCYIEWDFVEEWTTHPQSQPSSLEDVCSQWNFCLFESEDWVPFQWQACPCLPFWSWLLVDRTVIILLPLALLKQWLRQRARLAILEDLVWDSALCH